MRGNGIQCCCMRETGDRTEKASCQSVRATVIPESRREASIRMIDKFDFSKPEWTSNIICGSWARPQEMPFLASNLGIHKRLRVQPCVCMIAMAAVCLRHTVYFADTCHLGQDRVNYTICLLLPANLWPTVYMHDHYGTFYSTSLSLPLVT